MTQAPDFFTFWGPDADGRTGLVRCVDDAGHPPDAIWAASLAQAWALAAPEAKGDWVCSARLARALDLDAARVGSATDPQAMAMFAALRTVAPELKLMGMKYDEDAVVLLRALARLTTISPSLTDGRSTPFKVYMEGPESAFEFFAVLGRVKNDISVHVVDSTDKIRKLYEVGLSGDVALNFNMVYASSNQCDTWATQGIEDITAEMFLPHVFEYENGTPNPMTGRTSRMVTALVMALCGFVEEGPGTRWGTATRGGLYAVNLETIDL